MSADTQKKYWHYLSDEKRLYLSTHDYVKQDITAELCLRTEAGKRFAIMMNKIMTNQKISERKRNAKIRKMWYAQSPEEQMITYCMLPMEARPNRALEFLKFLSSGFLWIAAFGLAISWLPFNLLVGLSASLIILPSIIVKFAVGASLNLTDALTSEVLNKINPLIYYKRWKNLGSPLCKNFKVTETNEINDKTIINEINDKTIFEKLKKITRDEHKKKKFDMDKIIFYMLNMSKGYQLQAISLLSEEQKLSFLDYLVKCKPNTISPEVTKEICESTKIYSDLKFGNPEQFYKKCNDDELGKKLIASLIIGESKSLNARMHFERFIGVLKCMAIPAAFLFCAMWFPFMSVLASLIPMTILITFGIACVTSAFVILFKKCRNPNFLNPNRNFRNASAYKLAQSLKKELDKKENESDSSIVSVDTVSDKNANEGTQTQTKDAKLYYDKWKTNVEESKKNENSKINSIPEMDLDAGGAELQVPDGTV